MCVREKERKREGKEREKEGEREIRRKKPYGPGREPDPVHAEPLACSRNEQSKKKRKKKKKKQPPRDKKKYGVSGQATTGVA